MAKEGVADGPQEGGDTAFAEMLRRARGGRSVSSVAREAKVDRTSLGRAERGDRLLRLDTVVRLARYYNLSDRKLIRLMNEARSQRQIRRAAKGG